VSHQTEYVDTAADTREFGLGGICRSSRIEWLGLQALHEELDVLATHLTALLHGAISPKRLGKVQQTLKYYSSLDFLATITHAKWRETHAILLQNLEVSTFPEACCVPKCQRARLLGRFEIFDFNCML